MTYLSDTPNFKTWEKDDLAKWANDAYLSMQTNHIEMEQLRLMIASIIAEMQQVRSTLMSIVDPL